MRTQRCTASVALYSNRSLASKNGKTTRNQPSRPDDHPLSPPNRVHPPVDAQQRHKHSAVDSSEAAYGHRTPECGSSTQATDTSLSPVFHALMSHLLQQSLANRVKRVRTTCPAACSECLLVHDCHQLRCRRAHGYMETDLPQWYWCARAPKITTASIQGSGSPFQIEQLRV
ncbi:hypothetical protein BC628DRAFT_495923 [Trametes gibbosa]|nr:hypothetical protein BC628DRAFT_495923 [Trametes gibbosa]